MTDFANIWNREIPAEKKASVLAGVTDEAINSYLSAHRVHDSERYIAQRVFKDEDEIKLKLTLIVGGNKKEHSSGKAKPLQLSIPSEGDSIVSTNYRSFFDFPANHGSYTVDQIADQLPNIIVSARAISLYMEWPNSEGGSWSHHQDGIDFELESKLDLVEDDNRYSLRFVPVKLHISRSSEEALRKNIGKAIASDKLSVNVDAKISDLLMTVVELAATAIGPSLARNIAIPVFEFNKFDAFPTSMSISDGVVSVSAQLDFTNAILETSNRISNLKDGLMDAFQKDVNEAGGALELLYEHSILTEADSLPPQQRWDFLLSKPMRSESEVESRLTRTNFYTDEKLTALREEKEILKEKIKSVGQIPLARAEEGIGIAINEAVLDELVSEIGGITRKGKTPQLSLGLIRGYLGYQLKIGTPDITITTQDQLQGSVGMDVFAGLYYQVKEILNCSWRWSKEHRIGLGIKGNPKIMLKTRKSNGLSIVAEVDLGGLGIQTGLGAAIDRIINILLSPFRKAIELILNALLALFSFIVIPLQFAVPEQHAGIKLSGFETNQYLRHGLNDPQNNFLLVKCNAEGTKIV